jgi:hypothetical protein
MPFPLVFADELALSEHASMAAERSTVRPGFLTEATSAHTKDIAMPASFGRRTWTPYLIFKLFSLAFPHPLLLR